MPRTSSATPGGSTRCAPAWRTSCGGSRSSTPTPSPTPARWPPPRSSGELGALRERYGDGLDRRSHGESFLHFFAERLVPGGIYFLDEPEAPLSPARQLSFLALLKSMEAAASQVIVATHSPILLAYPGADLLSFDAAPLRRVRYEELEHVTLTRDFLRDPRRTCATSDR